MMRGGRQGIRYAEEERTLVYGREDSVDREVIKEGPVQ